MHIAVNKYPITFKSEMEEVYKTLYELKKTVKSLAKDLNIAEEEQTSISSEETKTAKAKKVK